MEYSVTKISEKIVCKNLKFHRSKISKTNERMRNICEYAFSTDVSTKYIS